MCTMAHPHAVQGWGRLPSAGAAYGAAMSGRGSPQRSAAQLREQAITEVGRLAPEFRGLCVSEAAAMALFAERS